MNALHSPKLRPLFLLFATAVGLCLANVSAGQQDKDKAAPQPDAATTLTSDVIRSLDWRCVGPATMSGRITAFAVFEADPSCYWVATASGGLLKTVNNGITFEHQFDKEATVSIGDVCVAQSDRNIVWVGTGEANPRNSVSYGDGVYKSTDGGKTWKNMGLKNSFQIGKIVIHPTDPNIVYVGALGRLYGPNTERGLFKTTDGGKTWDKIYYLDDKTGVIDIAMHPTDPDTLMVAMYERRRDGHDRYLGKGLPEPYDAYDPIVRFGEKAGIYKTTDGGKSFSKMTAGLPTCKLGRIGLSWHRKDPNIVYAIVDCENICKGAPPVKDKGEAADKDKKDKKDKDIELTSAEEMQKGGQGASKDRPYRGQYGSQTPNIQDEQGPGGFDFGGVYRSQDAGKTWKRVNSINPRPMYFSCIRVDPQNDDFVYVLGVSQSKSSNGGKTFQATFGKGVHEDGHALWIDPKDGRHILLGCDGGYYLSYDRGVNWDHLNNMALGQFYHVAMCSKKPYWLYGGLQDNGTWGIPSVGLRGRGPINEEAVRIFGNDGYVCRVDPSDPDLVYYESQDGGMGRRNLRTGEQAAIRPKQDKGGTPHRFNWNTPFILSHFNPKIYYLGGEFVFKSLDRGDDLKIISPEITLTKRGSATALSESPKNPDVLWAGTDDGGIWLTRDGGKNWSEHSGNVGLPGKRWVATLEASRFKEGRCYACFDAHRSDDDKPYLYVTEDFGQTWSPIHSNLPSFGSTRCLREDIANENLLYCGTEFNLFASIDRGANWAKINNNLPTVDVHEVAIHPTAGEICAATHGRSLWILDVTALRQMTPAVLAKAVHLFKPNTATRWQTVSTTGGTNRKFVGTNPPPGAGIYYHLANNAKTAGIKIIDVSGETISTLQVPAKKGLNVARWDTNIGGKGGQGGGMGGKGGGKGGQGGGGKGGFGGQQAPAGLYRVVLTVDGQDLSTTVRIEADPNVPALPPGAGGDDGDGF